MLTVLETFDDWWVEDEKTGCWEWVRSRNASGYGQVRRDGKPALAHRVSWERKNGPITDGLWVLHRCDNPACVNPDHLFLGTVRDNNADMVRKGRHRGADGAGERGRRAKLNWDQVNEIRRRYAAGGISQRALGVEYGVIQATIKSIVLGHTWVGDGSDPATRKRPKAEKPKRRTLVDRFDEVWIADPSTGCWIWPLSPSQECGKVRYSGKKVTAYRYSYMRAKGAIPDGLVVRHTCDNRRCVNPEHLVLGTQAENIRDMVSRGRQRSPRGEQCGLAKLSAYEVKEIRRRSEQGETRTAIAKDFPVSVSQISNIARRSVWAHVS